MLCVFCDLFVFRVISVVIFFVVGCVICGNVDIGISNVFVCNICLNKRRIFVKYVYFY